MIVFDLRCAGAGHVFEAWFGSSADYEDQRARGLLSCPVCGDSQVTKAVMAPAVAPKSNSRPASPPTRSLAAPVPMGTEPDMAKMRALMETLAQAQSKALENSTWVGRDFADQARAMHYGEQDHQRIHGDVAPEEARSLIEEGVPVAPLPFPVVPPKARN
ncbi:hypothetical protein GGR44_001352 [Sphingobium fontiphilum]|uniref:DUF1178 family protein n=1 Tax=Sphingobium fontiphilum TaxID=944425 RepID=A0A7W6DJC9_9SPHN|nr:DUF1178 family protein [Sphingobium fontiphilum]MBB3981705.1 hypothetical protein [Sphingobium fontiphilum]